MARDKTIQVAVLNITMHPHSPSSYVEAIRSVHAIRRAVTFQSNHFAMIGSFRPISSGGDPLDGMTGSIYRFLDFNKDQPWLNLSENKEADEGDLERIRIPDELKPDLKMTNFVFFPKHHLMFFESRSSDGKTLGPTNAKKIIERLLNYPELDRQYGPIDVTVEPSYDAVEAVLSIYNLRKLTIALTKPNPDFFGVSNDQEAANRLDAWHARKVETTLTAEKGESLIPDQGVREIAQVAASNGVVSGEGYHENGERAEESTARHPLKDVLKFDPDKQGALDALIQKASNMVVDIVRRR